MPAKRKYKDSVFTSLFKDKKRLLELLRDYLRQNSSEVVNMLTTEFKLKDALAVRYEEGI